MSEPVTPLDLDLTALDPEDLTDDGPFDRLVDPFGSGRQGSVPGTMDPVRTGQPTGSAANRNVPSLTNSPGCAPEPSRPGVRTVRSEGHVRVDAWAAPAAVTWGRRASDRRPATPGNAGQVGNGAPKRIARRARPAGRRGGRSSERTSGSRSVASVDWALPF